MKIVGGEFAQFNVKKDYFKVDGPNLVLTSQKIYSNQINAWNTGGQKELQLQLVAEEKRKRIHC